MIPLRKMYRTLSVLSLCSFLFRQPSATAEPYEIKELAKVLLLLQEGTLVNGDVEALIRERGFTISPDLYAQLRALSVKDDTLDQFRRLFSWLRKNLPDSPKLTPTTSDENL